MSNPRTSRRARRALARSRAEAQVAARKARRLEDAQRELAISRALARPPTRRAPESPFTAVAPSVRNLLGLARVDAGLRERTLDVFDLLARVAPKVCRADELPWVLLLASARWVRAPRTLRAADGDDDQRRDAVARHLLGGHRVPPFLWRALAGVDRLAIARVPHEDRWVAQLAAWCARGSSLRDAVGTLLPAGFTRAMCHAFASTSEASVRPALALRRAQVEALAGPRAFADALGRTALGSWLGPEREARWQEVLPQICARPWLTSLRGEALLDFVAWALAALDAGALSFAGRTAASVEALVRAHRAQLAAGTTSWGRSGLRGLREGDVVVRELRTAKELVAEGTRMGHCVGMYQPLVASGKVAIFSLEGPELRATLEVVPGLRRVVQVKGPKNRPPNPAVRELVGRWAAAAGVECAFAD